MNINRRTLNVRYDRFENFEKFRIAKIRRQTSIDNSLKKKFVRFDDIKRKFII